MEIILNATLAGGVGIGAACDLIVNPGVSMVVGLISGCISALGYVYLSGWLASKNLHDTCGINNLHGLPGIIGGIVSSFVFLTIESDFGSINSRLFLNSLESGREADNQFGL